MDCGSIGCGFESRLLPLKLKILNFFYLMCAVFSQKILFSVNIFCTNVLRSFLAQILFLPKFYQTSDLIWQEGLLIDFLQKKLIDNWTKKFLIRTAYLFNERLVFEKITNFFLNLLIWPLHARSFFDIRAVANMLWINIFIFIFVFISFSLFFLVL